MTQELKNWVEKNKLIVSELSSNGSDIIQIEGVGKFLYLQPIEGKVINSDFAFELSDEDFTDGQIDIISLLVKGGLVPTRSEGRRNVEQGGVTVDGEKVTDFKAVFAKEALAGDGVVVKRGKKKFQRIVVK